MPLIVRTLMLVFAIGLVPVLRPASFADAAVVATAQSTLASIEVEDRVSQLDADFVIEGVRLAQDFFVHTLGATIDRPVKVKVSAGSASDSPGHIAVASKDEITVYTGSIGWRQSSPAERFAVIVHEYTHFYQYLKLGLKDFAAPAWFDEGLAEYVSLQALASLRMVDVGDFNRYWARLLQLNPVDSPLESLETWPAFQSHEGAVYPYSYFGIMKLFQTADLTSIEGFYESMAAGASFDAAFFAVFGFTTDEFYAALEPWRLTLEVARELPADLSIYSPIEQESPIHLIDVPRDFELEQQSLVHVLAIPASACSIEVIDAGTASPIIARSTFADGNGDVFWLMTIPDDGVKGLVTIQMDCGGTEISQSAILQ
ncbi:hypothetical protein BH23CHL5_BH23CHL5_13550 [soil metagenome]